MKVICQVLAAVALVVTMLCTGEGGELGIEARGGGDQKCAIPLESGEKEEVVPQLVMSMSLNCFWSFKMAVDVELNTILVNSTTEKIRDTFKAVCELTPSYSNCTESAFDHAQNCVNDTLMELMRVDEDFIQKLMRVVCKNDGDRLVTIFQEERKLKKDHPLLQAGVEMCYRSALKAVVDNLINVVPDSATKRRVAINRVINIFRECFMSMPEQASVISHAFMSIMDDMLAKDK